MNSDSINVNNLHYHLECEILYDNPRVIINWDITDDEIGNLMWNEYSLINNNNDEYKNLMWVDEMKRATNWEEGKRITITLYKFNSQMIIAIPKLYLFQISYLVIDEDGYVLLKKSNNSSVQIFERCKCLYNDLLDISNSYILK